jgi:hypothetical protein
MSTRRRRTRVPIFEGRGTSDEGLASSSSFFCVASFLKPQQRTRKYLLDFVVSALGIPAPFYQGEGFLHQQQKIEVT